MLEGQLCQWSAMVTLTCALPRRDFQHHVTKLNFHSFLLAALWAPVLVCTLHQLCAVFPVDVYFIAAPNHY
jgi:hypothetical protein